MSAAEIYSAVSAKSECPHCLKAGRKRIMLRDHRMMHYLPESKTLPFQLCFDYDSECRHISEPLGFYEFAWKPVRRRNGRWVWLRFVECHRDGSTTLGNRAA